MSDMRDVPALTQLLTILKAHRGKRLPNSDN